jgi:hypothetical protein
MGMNPMKEPRHIFISYAKEDASAAERLHAELRAAGYRPWLDAHDLLPGQEWEREIEDAIKRSAAFVPLLSARSVTKTGFVQKEIRAALEVAERVPDGRVFVIPALLDDCQVPDRLARWHWVDLRKRDGVGRLKRALRAAGIVPKRRVRRRDELSTFERELLDLFVRSDRYMQGMIDGGYYAVTQGHVLAVLARIPKAYAKLKALVAHWRTMTTSQLQAVVPDAGRRWPKRALVEKVRTYDEMEAVVGLRSRTGTAYVNAQYWQLAQLCCLAPKFYVMGEGKPVAVVGRGGLKMLVMPLALPDEVKAKFDRKWD